LAANVGVDASGNGRVRSGESEIVNLAKEQDLVIVERGGVYISFVSGRGEANRLENLRDVLLPEPCCLRMTLEGMLYRENLATIKGKLKTRLVPFGKSIVDLNKSGNFWCWRMSKGILGITTIHSIVEGRGEGKE